MLKALIQKLLLLRRNRSQINGFTLIEVLVSLIIASLIVSTLLVFLNNILERDRREQTKVETQEEIQAALNYIADDVSQAVYIYDSDGLYQTGTDGKNVASQLPDQQAGTGVCNPTSKRCTPVLVFWKRYRYDSSDTTTLVKGGTSTTANRQVRCLQGPLNTTSTTPPNPNCSTGDQYVYSLVVYYLVRGDSSDTAWSNTSRIIRWDLKDGIPWACQDTSTTAQTDGFKCPIAANQRATYTPNGQVYAVLPDPGFLRFNLGLSATDLSVVMKGWRKDTANYTINSTTYQQVLVDYLDDTPYYSSQDDGIADNSPAGARININVIKNTPADTSAVPPIPSKNTTCDNADTGVGVGLTAAQLGTSAQTVFSQRIPADFGSTTFNPSTYSSFYACVNANNVSARVYIRSNALAKLTSAQSQRPVSDGVFDSFIPTSNVRVFGRGFLSTN